MEQNSFYVAHETEALQKEENNKLLMELMAIYEKDVWNYAYRQIRHKDLADDITQEVFIKVYYHLSSFRPECSMKTWLLTITRNTATDFKRSAFFRKVTLFYQIEDRKYGKSLEEEFIEKETIKELWDMVLSLPSKYQEVMILYTYYERSIKEIAVLLNLTEGTVKSRMFHARKRLRKMRATK